MAATPPASPPAVRRPAEERAAAEQAVFMREVDEAVRQDQVAGVAKRYGLVIGVVVAVVLALFAGWLFWQSRTESGLEAHSEQLVTAIDQLEAGNDRVADSQLETLAEEGNAAAAAPARLLRAGIALKENRTQDAVKLYDAVAADAEAPRPYRDFATIRSTVLSYDQLQPQQVIDRLGPLAQPDSAWYASAGELVALAYLAQDKRDEAGKLLAAIARDERTPETLKARTRQLAGLLGYDAVEDVDATLASLADPGEGAPAAPQQ